MGLEQQPQQLTAPRLDQILQTLVGNAPASGAANTPVRQSKALAAAANGSMAWKVSYGEYPCLVVDRPDVTLAEATEVLRAAGLAEYKIPLELITVEAVPLSYGGKTSRRRVTELLAGLAT